MKKNIILGLILIGSGVSAYADTSTTMKSSALLLANCDMVISDINFGNYQPGQELKTLLNVKVRCNNGITYELYLDGGESKNVLNRTMKNSNGELLSYNIFLNNEGTGTIFGNRHEYGVVSYFRTGSSGVWNSWTFGTKLYQNQFVSPGLYKDTISATISY